MSDSLSILSNGVKDANPFDDESEEWDDAGYELTDDGKAGEPVRYAASHGQLSIYYHLIDQGPLRLRGGRAGRADLQDR